MSEYKTGWKFGPQSEPEIIPFEEPLPLPKKSIDTGDAVLNKLLKENSEAPSFLIDLLVWAYNNNKDKLEEILKINNIGELIKVEDIDYNKLKNI
jgi:hypothetical protein